MGLVALGAKIKYGIRSQYATARIYSIRIDGGGVDDVSGCDDGESHSQGIRSG